MAQHEQRTGRGEPMFFFFLSFGWWLSNRAPLPIAGLLISPPPARRDHPGPSQAVGLTHTSSSLCSIARVEVLGHRIFPLSGDGDNVSHIVLFVGNFWFCVQWWSALYDKELETSDATYTALHVVDDDQTQLPNIV